MENPIVKNDVFETEIITIANDGSGVSKDKGVTVFVPNTAVGDFVEVKAVKVTKSLIYARLLRVITSSPDRIENDCPAFPVCGGCEFRHIFYEAELRAKESFIRDAFKRIGKLSPKFLPIVGSEKNERYRNKAQYPIGKDVNDKAISGFYATRSHRIVPCHDCKLQPEIFSEIKNFIVDYIRVNHLSVYDEMAHHGVLRHLCLRKGERSGEINVCIVARRKIPELSKLAHIIIKEFPSVKGVVLDLNSEKTNNVFGEKKQVILAGAENIIDTMCDVEVIISPRSFYQVNTPAAEIMYGIIADFAQHEGKTVLDLYCGIGTIGLMLAKKAKEVIGVELQKASIKNALPNAEQNGISNVRFICSDAKELEEVSAVKIDIVILDPARKGCEPEVLHKIAELSPERIVMASCEPATAARDCKLLAELGYKTTRVAGVDLFPRTRHVECVAELIRADS
ncbi:MAG: 23S rRNA (uracil(1939)-C(5))-methyltransferase RlmD [Oscillospiraceae bacterium]|nr:23S rRNA (uracil(1939)-C(5))-methyltransferase RlmD [Oscillospiraceae bacterium]